MSQHLEPRIDNRIQVAGLVVVIAAAAALIGVIVWGTVTGRELGDERAAESARLQFELTRANICVNSAILAVPLEERSAERVQMVVNDCLAQVELPFVSIDVPDE